MFPPVEKATAALMADAMALVEEAPPALPMDPLLLPRSREYLDA